MTEDRKEKYTCENGQIKLILLTPEQKQEAKKKGKELEDQIKQMGQDNEDK